jgi:glycosyltransferase involved in cell wall biosynthesis
MSSQRSASVIVNNCNYGRFLRAAIDSALAQTYPDVEVVVVDDGSSDDSRDIIASYGTRIRAVLQPNGGQASALNAGFAHSTGDVIFFLDADDVLDAGAVQAVMGAWREGVAKIQFFLDIIDADGQPLGSRLPPDRPWKGQVRDLLLAFGSYPSTGTTGNGFARALLDRIMPVPEQAWRRFPDSYLILLAPFFGDVLWIDRTLGGYRAHGGNQWTMESVRVGRLREGLLSDDLREAALREWAADIGIDVPPAWNLRLPNHLQARLASLVLSPADHPYHGDRRWALALRGARASLGAPPFRWRKRCFFAGWFLLTGLLPRRPALALVDLGYLRVRRPALLQSLVS